MLNIDNIKLLINFWNFYFAGKTEFPEAQGILSAGGPYYVKFGERLTLKCKTKLTQESLTRKGSVSGWDKRRNNQPPLTIVAVVAKGHDGSGDNYRINATHLLTYMTANLSSEGEYYCYSMRNSVRLTSSDAKVFVQGKNKTLQLDP